jgi:cytosine/adenosine deaminase-related metal-dependent hydrolase
LVYNGILVTMDARRRVLVDGALRIEGSKITKVGKTSEIKHEPRAEFEIDAKGMMIIPGLIDTHVHTAQALLRGCADDASFIDWLQKYVWPLQGNFEERDGKASAELCMLEMIKSGTTTFLETHLHRRYGFDGIAKSVEDIGMRGVLAKTVMSLPGYGNKQNIMHPGMVEDGETCLHEVEDYFKRWNGKAEDRIKVWYGPRSLGGCTPELYKQIAEGSKRLGTGITMHLGEVREDASYTEKEFNKLPVEFMNELGLIGPQVVFSHGVWFTEKEWSILASKGTSVANSPTCNMKVAVGIAKIPEMINAGVNVGLACDGGPSNNCYDMIREMKMASLLQKVRLLDPRVMNAETVLEMATINGARAVGLDRETGSIEQGKKADVVLVSLQSPQLVPPHNPISNLVYAGAGSDVDTVIIDGRIIMKDRKMLTLNEENVLREAKERAARLLERAGVKITPKWGYT